MTLAQSDRGWISGTAGEGIVTIGDPRMKAPTRGVADVDDVAELLTTLVDRLRSLNGAGLSAPQIGVSVKVMVVEVRRTDVFPDRTECPLIQMVNPVIVARSHATIVDWEGCFGVPGLMGQVPRAETITVEYVSPDGKRVASEFSGYVARVIQHEADHLDGVEFLDRMTSLESLTTVQNYVAFHRR
ncbi:peptide deformylase [Longispora sp. NPDC051575]|uniref:peptide deformylase n=1 Tax=Longispora sp. NPDC051575 TaxID=3154943 RepID=UPI0034289BF7